MKKRIRNVQRLFRFVELAVIKDFMIHVNANKIWHSCHFILSCFAHAKAITHKNWRKYERFSHVRIYPQTHRPYQTSNQINCHIDFVILHSPCVFPLPLFGSMSCTFIWVLIGDANALTFTAKLIETNT